MRRLFLSVGMLLMVISSAFATEESPERFIETFTHEVWSKLERSRDRLKQDPQVLKAFVEQEILPYLATEKMARYAMGKFWRQASDEQKSRFVTAFQEMLLRSYANSLLNLEITAMKVDKVIPAKRGRYQVEQIVQRKGAPETKVVYRVYWDKKQQRWKVYDMVVENVSLLLSYRKVFNQQLQEKGIDAVIRELEEKNRAFLERKAASSALFDRGWEQAA